MLNLLEKIMYVFSGLVVLGAVALYAWQGVEYRSLDMMPEAKKTVRPPAPTAKAAGQPGKGSLRPAVAPENQAILDRLAREQGVRGLAGKDLIREDYAVDPGTYDYVKRKANLVPELNKAKSQLLPGPDGRNTRLKLFDIEDGSLIKKFGFQDGDILEFVDGEKIDFGGSSSTDHMNRWQKVREKLDKGQPISLTVSRGGREPVQMEFKLK